MFLSPLPIREPKTARSSGQRFHTSIVKIDFIEITDNTQDDKKIPIRPPPIDNIKKDEPIFQTEVHSARPKYRSAAPVIRTTKSFDLANKHNHYKYNELSTATPYEILERQLRPYQAYHDRCLAMLRKLEFQVFKVEDRLAKRQPKLPSVTECTNQLQKDSHILEKVINERKAQLKKQNEQNMNHKIRLKNHVIPPIPRKLPLETKAYF